MPRLIFAAALAAAAAFRPPCATRITHQPRRPSPCSNPRRAAAALRALAKDDMPEEDTEEIKELRERMLAEELRARAGELKEGGSNRLAAQYVKLLTEQHPSELVGRFYATASIPVQAAMQDAIAGLLGAGAVDLEVTTTGSRVADLCFRLQMTGYMLRNAEYVLALQEVLSLAPAGRTPAQMRAAFQRVDRDASGYIDVGEVGALFDDVYGPTDGDRGLAQRKKADVESFVAFFDKNKDGRISFDEFCDALGGADATPAQLALEKYGGARPQLEAPEAAAPAVSGELTVGDRTVGAAEYVDELRREAARLKRELAAAARTGPGADSLAAIGSYVASLEPEKRDLLTASMTPDAREAAAELVKYVLKEPGAGGDEGQTLGADQQVTLERRVLDQICRWQIVVGYRLRELEASGEAKRRLGA